jgi:hypothetical protein
MTKDVRITDFLTEHEIKIAHSICSKLEPHMRNKAITERIIEPNMARINRALNQENDPRFLAYAVEYCILKRKGAARGRPRSVNKLQSFGRGK